MQRGGSGKQRNKRDVRREKINEGSRLISEDILASKENYDLNWFKPTEGQKEIIYSMCSNPLSLVQASSGCGKSTTAIYQALKQLSSGHYKQLVFIKTPSEVGDDQIGYLPSSAEDKISVHMEAMRSIFLQFMSKAKLELEEKRGKIVFTIPNFIAGKTLDNSIVIIDESQMLSPPTLKLLIERCGDGSTYVVLGDKHQTYSAKKRVDGFSELVGRVTTLDENNERYSFEPLIGYVELTAKDNMRSELSRRIVEIYEGE